MPLAAPIAGQWRLGGEQEWQFYRDFRGGTAFANPWAWN
jgi:hypothetical protein